MLWYTFEGTKGDGVYCGGPGTGDEIYSALEGNVEHMSRRRFAFAV
jgi:hypothetical protein